MFLPALLNRRSVSLALPIAAIAYGCAVLSPANARAASAPSDPTHPQTQSNLTVDRDPVRSPDPEVAPAPPTASAKVGQIEKRKDGTYTLHQDVDEVLLNCAVVDEKGRPVLDLKRDDFRVWENGVPQVTTSFLHQDLPVSMGLLIDNSGSMRDKREAVNQAAMKLLAELNSKDTVFVVNFSDRALLDQGFTSDLAALNRAVNRFDTRGETALYDAVAASADELARHGKQAKQVLLIITDGADNASRLNLQQAIARVQRLGGPVVYAIGLLYDSEQAEARSAKGALESLSQETGGIAYFPRSLGEVDSIADQVAQDIRNQYTVGYRSRLPATLGGYRTLQVMAKSPRHGKLIVRTRHGYYAQARRRNQVVENSSQEPYQPSVR